MAAIQSSPLYYFRLVSPTANVVLAGAITNTVKDFNTNVPFGMAMVIRRVYANVARKTIPDSGGAVVNQILWGLYEDTTKTSVAGSDPFVLVDGGYEEFNVIQTAVGFHHSEPRDFYTRYDFLPPHPGVPTVAQQLRLIATGNRTVGASVQSYDVGLVIFYELVPFNENIRTFLTNRIALQRLT